MTRGLWLATVGELGGHGGCPPQRRLLDGRRLRLRAGTSLRELGVNLAGRQAPSEEASEDTLLRRAEAVNYDRCRTPSHDVRFYFPRNAPANQTDGSSVAWR